jgi:hypothetical protein
MTQDDSAFLRTWAQSLKPQRNVALLSAEEFLEHPDMCDLAISDGQRALARLAEGSPQTLDPLDMEFFLGAHEWPKDLVRPSLVTVEAGRRSGKSLIAALLGLGRAAITLPLRRKPEPGEKPERDGLVGVRKGELVRGLIASPRLRQALGTFQLFCAVFTNSPALKRYVRGTPGVTSITLIRDDQQEVTIEVIASAPRGTNMRGGWLVGAVIDEADYLGEKDAAITLDEQIEAAKPALVPGGQIWAVSSPWDESGQFHDKKVQAFGRPGGTVFFHGSTVRMNPTYPTAVIEEHRSRDPEFVAREYDAVPMASGSDGFFSEAAIMMACSDEVFPKSPDGTPHFAGCDPGLRKNSATIAISRLEEGRAALAYYHEFVPPKKTRDQMQEDIRQGIPPGLAPSLVFKFFATKALEYDAAFVEGDQWYEDSAIEHMPQVSGKDGRTVYYKTVVDNAPSTAALFTKFRSLMNEGRVRLPKDPRLIQQLKDTKVRKGEGGGVRIILPKTGTAHGDLLKSVVLSICQVPVELYEPEKPVVELGWNAFGGRTVHGVGGRSRRLV